MNLAKVRAVMEFLGVDKATVREMSAETKDETYCISLLMLYHCGLIYLPEYLHSSYRNPLHSMEGAIKRMRALGASMYRWARCKYLSHLIFGRYNSEGKLTEPNLVNT